MLKRNMKKYYQRIKIKMLLRKPRFMWLWHIVFWWYYKRIPEFYRTFPPLKSLKVLVENYNWVREQELPIERKLTLMYCEEASKLRKELSAIKLQQAASGLPKDTVVKIAEMFAINIPDN